MANYPRSAVNLNLNGLPHYPSSSTSTASSPTSPTYDMHHRPPTLRSSSSSMVSSRVPTPRHSPLLPSASPSYPMDKAPFVDGQHLHPLHQPQQPLHQHHQQHQPSICGLPLKYVSLVTLAVQNAALSIVMHYSRVSIPPALAYSPASAVLLNELLKGSISFVIAFLRSPLLAQPQSQHPLTRRRPMALPMLWFAAFTDLCGEIFSLDAWKLSIPAILYVVQNSLQFVAISNLPVASFQVTYQMKILTTAAFSVALLRKKLTGMKWLALFFLAIGVGIVQIQTSTIKAAPKAVGSAHEFHHVMSPLKGFGAVTAACFTSGLAGVYFEMVLKGSKADLWVRNVQLSLFSLIPALLPILYASPPPNSRGFFLDLFRHFGGWAWATVIVQVLGGLITAIVIKYSDNILKGFATSLSIVLSFLASVVLFDFRITPSFVIGASTVLGATWMYNQPAPPAVLGAVAGQLNAALPVVAAEKEREKEELEWEREQDNSSFSLVLNNASPSSSGKSSPSPSPYYPSTPLSMSSSSADLANQTGGSAGGSVLGLGVGSFMRRKSSGGVGAFGASRTSSTNSLSGLLNASLTSVQSAAGQPKAPGHLGLAESGELVHPEGSMMMMGGASANASPYGSRVPSRAPSPSPRMSGRTMSSGEGWSAS